MLPQCRTCNGHRDHSTERNDRGRKDDGIILSCPTLCHVIVDKLISRQGSYAFLMFMVHGIYASSSVYSGSGLDWETADSIYDVCCCRHSLIFQGRLEEEDERGEGT